MKILSIDTAVYINDYLIELHFNDGKVQKVDFEKFLKGSSHPEINKYLDLNLFKSFEVSEGDLIWNDYDLVFPIIDLYENRIDKSASKKSQAS
jgi:hypothetical protein